MSTQVNINVIITSLDAEKAYFFRQFLDTTLQKCGFGESFIHCIAVQIYWWPNGCNGCNHY
uniref:Uncharacterized protein n=1 Tax=Anguilla anguilla TaxID=7936 RepID=A0A0E9PBU1_ANGAN